MSHHVIDKKNFAQNKLRPLNGSVNTKYRINNNNNFIENLVKKHSTFKSLTRKIYLIALFFSSMSKITG